MIEYIAVSIIVIFIVALFLLFFKLKREFDQLRDDIQDLFDAYNDQYRRTSRLEDKVFHKGKNS